MVENSGAVGIFRVESVEKRFFRLLRRYAPRKSCQGKCSEFGGGIFNRKINKIIIVLKNYLPEIPPHWSIFLKFST